jgi:hypothetical protein
VAQERLIPLTIGGEDRLGTGTEKSVTFPISGLGGDTYRDGHPNVIAAPVRS